MEPGPVSLRGKRGGKDEAPGHWSVKVSYALPTVHKAEVAEGKPSLQLITESLATPSSESFPWTSKPWLQWTQLSSQHLLAPCLPWAQWNRLSSQQALCWPRTHCSPPPNALPAALRVQILPILQGSVQMSCPLWNFP